MQDHRETGLQTELLPCLVEGMDPDAYVVIPVAMLTRQVEIDWHKVAKAHRGEVRLGWFQIAFMRSLLGLGVLVDNRHTGNGMDGLDR